MCVYKNWKDVSKNVNSGSIWLVPKSCSLCVCLYAGITLFDYCSFGQRFEVRECETSNSVLFQGGFEYFGGAGEFL